MDAIKHHPELELQTVVTGMHLLPQHGNTYTEVEKDGFDIDRIVEMANDSDTGVSMAKSLGTGTQGMAETFDELEPDIVLVLGDRDEPLAAALSAAHMNIPVAHIHGGEVAVGTCVDDMIRHAITKFSHIHFPASEESAERISKLGEEQWRITISGAPGLDRIRKKAYPSPEEVYDRYEIRPSDPIVLGVQHPLTTKPEQAGEQMRETVDALKRIDASKVLIYPNSDAGGDDMITVIEEHATGDEFILRKNVPRRWYLALMDAADALVGNSSSGLLEAPSLDLPFVEVGPRQTGRQRGDNVINVPHDSAKIYRATKQCLTDENIRQKARECENPFDYGGAGERIAERLTEIEINDTLFQKRLDFE